MLKALNSNFIPNKVVIFRSEKDESEIAQIAKYTMNQKPVNSNATAYVCRDFACSLPTTEPDEMLRIIEQQSD
jgi:uncharacterized protein YyaL (SSP411 family)